MQLLVPVLHQPLWQSFTVVEHAPPAGTLKLGAGVPNSEAGRQKLMPLTLVHVKSRGQLPLAPQGSEHRSCVVMPIVRLRHVFVVHCASRVHAAPITCAPGRQRPVAALQTFVPVHAPAG
jgi:hypothetical protein